MSGCGNCLIGGTARVAGLDLDVGYDHLTVVPPRRKQGS